MKNKNKLITTIMKKNIKVVLIDFKNKEFTTDDGNLYPILFDIDNNTTVEDFQKAIDDSKKIMLKIIAENE
jgi:Na+-transporting NADH:ubiquinone oxidoreductase subunit NqrC